jgi:ABC-type Fe3+/spermidine/putrescine transport system ATPase subunit
LTVLRLEKLTKVFPRAGRVVDSIDLQIESGEFFTLLGPSGCGKSTILRMIAGFEEPTGGHIFFDSRDVTDEPANRRGIGFVFQNYALFPHLTVAENVAFGLRVRRVSRTETEERVAGALNDVQLAGLDGERVDRLSGGQQQRVALARALVIRPGLLLLDEPLSNLDAKLREDTRAMLRTLRSSNSPTTIYVTHDQAEAMGMSDRVAVLHQGRIHQVGAPEEIYERPATRFVADFIGRNNVLDATVVSVSGQFAKLRFADGNELTVNASHKSHEVQLSPGASVGVCVRAESLRLAIGSGTFAGTITDVEYAGAVRTCRVSTGVGDLQVEVPSSAGRLSKGQAVRLSVNESAIHLVGPRKNS